MPLRTPLPPVLCSTGELRCSSLLLLLPLAWALGPVCGCPHRGGELGAAHVRQGGSGWLVSSEEALLASQRGELDSSGERFPCETTPDAFPSTLLALNAWQ